jgi:hypothetical protein
MITPALRMLPLAAVSWVSEGTSFHGAPNLSCFAPPERVM